MSYDERDFEIRVQGHTLVRVRDGGVRIDGKDFHADLRSLNELVEILTDVIATAEEAGKPRLVADSAPVPQTISSRHKAFPYKVIGNG